MEKNRYVKRSKITEKKFREIVKLFSLDIEATKIAKLTGLNRNTVNRYLRGIREEIIKFCEAENRLKGMVEADESYFGAKRVKGKRGRGAGGKNHRI